VGVPVYEVLTVTTQFLPLPLLYSRWTVPEIVPLLNFTGDEATTE
jgi:hypothetical protein